MNVNEVVEAARRSTWWQQPSPCQSVALIDHGALAPALIAALALAWRRDHPALPLYLYWHLKTGSAAPDVTPLPDHMSQEHNDFLASLAKEWPWAIGGFHPVSTADPMLHLVLLFQDDAASALRKLAVNPEALFCITTPDDTALLQEASRRISVQATLYWSPVSREAERRLSDSGMICQPVGTCRTWLTAQRRPLTQRRSDRHDVAQPVAQAPLHQLQQRLQRNVHIPQRSAIVVGAGLAGCQISWQLAKRGWQVQLLEQNSAIAQEASGNLAGFFMPPLARVPQPTTRLLQRAYFMALKQWEQLGGIGSAFAGQQCGVLHQPRSAVTPEQLSEHWPASHRQHVDALQASALAGTRIHGPAWWFAQAGWLSPSDLCAALLRDAGPAVKLMTSSAVRQCRREQHQWQVIGDDNEWLGQAATLIFTSGIAALPASVGWTPPLQAVRGQVTTINAQEQAGSFPALSIVLSGESYLIPGPELSVGATFDTGNDAGLNLADQLKNLTGLASLLPDWTSPADLPLAGRVGWRAVTPDRLPLIGPIPDWTTALSLQNDISYWHRQPAVPHLPGLSILSGLGSHGILWSVIGAAMLADRLDGRPASIEADLIRAVNPARFAPRSTQTGA